MTCARTAKRRGMPALALAFKLALAAQDHWRWIGDSHPKAVLRVGAEFKNGKQIVSHFDMDMRSLQAEDPIRCGCKRL